MYMSDRSYRKLKEALMSELGKVPFYDQWESCFGDAVIGGVRSQLRSGTNESGGE